MRGFRNFGPLRLRGIEGSSTEPLFSSPVYGARKLWDDGSSPFHDRAHHLNITSCMQGFRTRPDPAAQKPSLSCAAGNGATAMYNGELGLRR